jgi:hypothetical protein
MSLINIFFAVLFSLEDICNSSRALLAGFLPALFFGPEDGGDIFLRNVDFPSTGYRALSPRR